MGTWKVEWTPVHPLPVCCEWKRKPRNRGIVKGEIRDIKGLPAAFWVSLLHCVYSWNLVVSRALVGDVLCVLSVSGLMQDWRPAGRMRDLGEEGRNLLLMVGRCPRGWDETERVSRKPWTQGSRHPEQLPPFSASAGVRPAPHNCLDTFPTAPRQNWLLVHCHCLNRIRLPLSQPGPHLEVDFAKCIPSLRRESSHAELPFQWLHAVRILTGSSSLFLFPFLQLQNTMTIFVWIVCKIKEGWL